MCKRKYYWLKAIYSFFCGKFDYANKVTHYALVPKVLLIGFLFIMTIVSYFLPKDIIVGFNFWLTITLLYYLAFAMAIPKIFWNKNTSIALLSMPKTVLVMVLAMFNIKGANKSFIHTPHSAQFENNNA